MKSHDKKKSVHIIHNLVSNVKLNRSPSVALKKMLSMHFPCCFSRFGFPSASFNHSRLAAAVVVIVADALALANLYAGLSVVGGCGSHALLDLAGHGEESLLDVAGILG